MTGLARPLVGRERELDVVEQLLDETCAGSARFLFVAGEPGIGKTRLLDELLGRAAGRGCLALHGSAAEFERELPFGLLVDAVDAYLASLDPRGFQRLAAEDLFELADVFPALRAHGPRPDRPATAAERFRAHRAVRELLERLAARQPVVLGLDDLHWADGASIELASHLLRRPPDAGVMVAATYRAAQVDRTIVTAIERGMRETDRRIELGPLPREQAHALVGGASNEYERLYDASGGNPFYLLELARLGGDGERLLDAGVPDAVAVATLEELEGLSARGRDLAAAASVAGDPFELDLAAASADMPEEHVLVALDELVARDLVRATQVPRRFRFRHPLVRRAVYESCSPGARIVAHRRSAEALAARGAAPATRAHHVEHSAPHGDATAIALLREAGEAAAGRAPESAARWYGAALRLLPEDAPATERVALLIDLARARAATGAFAECDAALAHAIELTPAGEETLRMRLIGWCAAVEQLLGRHEEANTRLERALGELSDGSSPSAVGLMAQLAVGDFYRMDYEAMRAWGTRALDASREAGDEVLIAASVAVLAVAEAFMGAFPEADAHRAQAAALVDALPDDRIGVRLDALANLSTAELYMHRYDEAGAHADRGLAIARARGDWDLPPVLVPVLSAALHLRGRIGESSELLDGAVEAARLSGDAHALGWNLLSRAFTAVAAGDLALALELAEESVEVTRGLDDSLVSTYASLALAGALGESGEPARAVEVLVTAAGGEELRGIARGWRASYFELLVHCRLALGQTAAAARAATRAAAMASETGLGLAVALARRAEAEVALATGDFAAATDLGLASAVAADDVGARVEAARARTLAGRALAAAGRRESATAQLEIAVGELAACGARRYRQEAEFELRKLGRRFHSRTEPARADAAGIDRLTGRELDVARLVVDRRTNPEIARELFLSEKTIETHMRNIFRKLDVTSRADVARTMERAGDVR